jgi:hypothetical protein
MGGHQLHPRAKGRHQVLAAALFLKGVAMWSSRTGGLEGHQWHLHRTSGTRLPFRVVCECGWTSTAGPDTAVLLELKGHLEDSLHSGTRLIPTHDQPSDEASDSRPT